MRYLEIERYLNWTLSPPSKEGEDRQKWLEGTDVVPFLRSSRNEDVPIYVGTPFFYLYAVLVPKDRLSELAGVEPSRIHSSPSRGWRFSAYRDSETKQPTGNMYVDSGAHACDVLDAAEPIVYFREFAGNEPDGGYVELNQRIAHITGIHRVDERSAYSRIDETGDFADVVRIGRVLDRLFCTMDAAYLDRYMFLTSQALVRVFDVRRSDDWDRWRAFQQSDEEEVRNIAEPDLIAEHLILRSPMGADGSTQIGMHWLSSVGDRDEQLRKLLGEDRENRRGASFLVRAKNGQVGEWPPSSRRDKAVFREGDPPQITPTFFRGEVLSRFKRHPEKYTLTQSTVECRGAWFLRSYDVNEAGQVYAYLKDLWTLPYQEQLYWRSFNEAPKAGISERSFAQDFLAEFWQGPDPLMDLKQVLRDFPSSLVEGQVMPIWERPMENPRRSLKDLHYVVTDSPGDWGDHIRQLAIVVVEGLRTGLLRRIARAHRCPEAEVPTNGSIILLRSILTANAVDEDMIDAICKPLRELQRLRSQAGVAHRGSDLPKGDLRLHYRQLLTDLASGMQQLSDLVAAGLFNLPVNPQN
jgi:hypothetical protein